MSSQKTNNGGEGPGKDDKVAEYKNVRRESRLKLYPILTDLYEQFLYLKAHEQEQDKFVGRCIREGMTIEAGTDLAVILVRLSLNPSREETSIYASALHEADLQGVRAEHLEKTLRKNGIRTMARRFVDRGKEPSGKTIILDCSDSLWKKWQHESRLLVRFGVKRLENGRGEVTKISGPKRRPTELAPVTPTPRLGHAPATAAVEDVEA